MPTLRIAAMANLPTLDGDEGEGTIHPQMTAASMADGIYSVHHDPMQDVVMPPSPRLPLLLRPRTTRAGHWNGSVLAEWVRLNTPSDED